MVCFSQWHYTSQQVFRDVFQFKNRSVVHWFPGHMGKGVRQMQQKLKSVDCIIEVHDARIPFSGRNPESFRTVCGLRPHILVYNKRDLTSPSAESVIIDKHKKNGMEHVVFTNCRDNKCKGVKTLVPLVQKLMLTANRHNRFENLDYCLMVIGVPNVGKSSLINALRNRYLLKGNAVPVGAKPGITKAIGEKIKVSDDPLIYVLDTPGILTPKVPTIDVGMKLALCATIPDTQVGIELIADYLLFWLNKHGNFRYVDYFGVDSPTDNISEFLTLLATKENWMMKIIDVTDGKYVYRPNLGSAASVFVDSFRKGELGSQTLDIDLLDKGNEERHFIMNKKVVT